MGWDIFIMDLPRDAPAINEIPHDYEQQPLGTGDEVRAAVLEVVPETDFSDPTWGSIEDPAFHIAVSISDEEPVMCVALHVHGGEPAPAVVAAIVERLGGTAADPSSETGLFSAENAEQSFNAFRAYRDRVLEERLNPGREEIPAPASPRRRLFRRR